MKLAHQYKLLPTSSQRSEVDRWLDMLRCQYNWMLAQRFQWWEQNRVSVNACPLICHLPELKEQPDYYSQKRALVPLKQARPWYKDIYSQVLQDMVKRVKLAFERYLKGDGSGKRSGKPRFQGKNRYRSFTYPQASIDWIDGNKIKLPKIGAVKVIWHRPLPDGFKVKTAIVTKKADGYYITLTLEDSTVPEQKIDIKPSQNNSIGIDLGLEHLIADSGGEFFDYPRYLRQSEKKLGILQRKRESKAKGSKAKNVLNRRIARHHQKIARQRYQFHCETANKLLDKADVIFLEDLSVSNMNRKCKPKQDEQSNYLPNGQSVKSGLNKSFADAGLSQFANQVLPFKAERAGKLIKKVDPRGTSQYGCICLNKVPKQLSNRWHSCPHCNNEMQRDTNSAILIKKVGSPSVASLKNANPGKSRRRSPRCTA